MPVMRKAERAEDDEKVVYTFALIDDNEDSMLIVYKTIPPSFKYAPSSLNAVRTLVTSWEKLVAQHDDSDVEWTSVVAVSP